MPNIKGLVPIAQAERIITQRQIANKLDSLKKEVVRIVTEDLKDFDMSVKTVFARNYVCMASWGRLPSSVEDAIMRTQNESSLQDVKREIAYSALVQLGAVYSVEKKGGWGRYNSSCYDSPTLRRKEIEILDNFSFFNRDFDPDVVFKDVPLLIKKSKELAGKLSVLE